MSKFLTAVTVLLLVLLVSGCAPEPGSKQWCERMEDKAKGDWTAKEAKTFAKHCIMGNYVDEKD